MPDDGTGAWTRRLLHLEYRRISALQTALRTRQATLDPGELLVATDEEVRQYTLLLEDLRAVGMDIADWHDLKLDANGTVSGRQMLDALDVLSNLVEDDTNTRMDAREPQ